MSRIMAFTIIAYIAMFCCVPFFRGQFLRHDQHELFWILVPEHLVMIPVSIMAFMTSFKSIPSSLAFCLGAIVTAAALFFLFCITVMGMSDRGMGIIIFLIFPLAEAALAAVGAVSGLIYLIKRIGGAY